MTDQNETKVNETKAEQKLADDYAKDGTKKPGHTYRWVTRNGVTSVVVEKIG